MRLQTRLELHVFFFENHYFRTVGLFIVCFRNANKPLNLWTGLGGAKWSWNAHKPLNLWPRPFGPWPKLWVLVAHATHLWVSRRWTQRKEAKALDTCADKFPLVSIGGWAEGLACADLGVRTPIGASGNFYLVLCRSDGANRLGVIYEDAAAIRITHKKMPSRYSLHQLV